MDKELADAIRELKEEMELCRKTYVALWTCLAISLFVILTKMVGAW